jgi:hypothetical protein
MIYLAHDPRSLGYNYCLFALDGDRISIGLVANWHKNPPSDDQLCHATTEALENYYEHNQYELTEFDNIDDYLQWRSTVPELLI